MLLNPRWRKIIRDLRSNLSRTAIVVLSIAIGIFAVGMISASFVFISRDMTGEYVKINPHHAAFGLSSFDSDLVEAVKGLPAIAEAEGSYATSVRFRLDEKSAWQDLNLAARLDYQDLAIDLIRPELGDWPPPRKQLLVERQTLDIMTVNEWGTVRPARIGDTVTIELAEDEVRDLVIAGTVHDLNQFPSAISKWYYGYVTFDTLDWLGYPRTFNSLRIITQPGADNVTSTINPLGGSPYSVFSKTSIETVVEDLRTTFERGDMSIRSTRIPEPGEHPANAPILAILYLMAFLGVLSLFLSGFLVINTISALLTQQITQIGIMKAIGARTSQMIAMYLVMVIAYGLLSFILAFPLANIGARGLSDYIAGLVNFSIQDYSPPVVVVVLELFVAIIIPLLSALVPIWKGVSIPVVDALNSQATSGKGGKTALDRLLDAIIALPRPLILSLRNTFRQKGRLLLSLITLTLGGAIFISVFSVRDSLFGTLDDALQYSQYDVRVSFAESHQISQLQRQVRQEPGVMTVETWGGAAIQRVLPGGDISVDYTLTAPPADSAMIEPVLLEGRWLQQGDRSEIVVNSDFLNSEDDLALGSSVELNIKGKEKTFTIVGIVKGVLSGEVVYMTYDYFSTLNETIGRSSRLLVATERHDGEFQQQIASRLEERFDNANMPVASTQTLTTLRESLEFRFNIIVVFLLIMAVLIAVVGGLGLMGLMSINVLERTREIAVMRSIGASDFSVLSIFVVEGVLIGVMSWVLAILVAFPLSMVMSYAVGIAFTNAPLSFTYSQPGALMWLGIVVILSFISSIFPAWKATRVTIRDALAYE